MLLSAPGATDCPRSGSPWLNLAVKAGTVSPSLQPDFNSSVNPDPLVPPWGRDSVSRQKWTSPRACLRGICRTHMLSPARFSHCCVRHTIGASKADPSAGVCCCQHGRHPSGPWHNHTKDDPATCRINATLRALSATV